MQGALVERERSSPAAIDAPYRASSVASVVRLDVAFQGRTLDRLGAAIRDGGTRVRRSSPGPCCIARGLSPPFGDVELAFVVDSLPRAPGTALLAWVAVTLAAVLVGGFLLMYRFGVGQMRLARQQQDFVSAVSHELKTPLTSIRMYGEMLKAGWADEAKRQTYYDYIHSESERLSRLIENVLQLARLTRNTQRFDLKQCDGRRAAGPVALEGCDAGRARRLLADDAQRRAGRHGRRRRRGLLRADLHQSRRQRAEVLCGRDPQGRRDRGAARRATAACCSRCATTGPACPSAQMKKIFELFYRAENELTRETVGTGIGLALVRQLAAAMGARVDVRNCDPGAEFRLQFPGDAAALTVSVRRAGLLGPAEPGRLRPQPSMSCGASATLRLVGALTKRCLTVNNYHAVRVRWIFAHPSARGGARFHFGDITCNTRRRS